MSNYIKIMIIIISVAVAIGFAPANSLAQLTGPAALAAKQEIKAQVLSAMVDGKITEDERRKILFNARDVCTAKEYVGLVETINRLSPPDRATPENLGYAPVTDKKLMAKFPTLDLSWIEKSPVGKTITKQYIVKETTPKQSYVVREIITKQTIIKETVPTQSVAKASAPKQSVAKTTKPSAASKVVVLPSPPQQKNDNQLNPSTVGKEQNKIAKADDPMPPMPPAEQSQILNTTADKSVQHKVAESPKKHPITTGDQVKIQQPAQLWNEAEKPVIKSSYSDYSVPVLTTPAAALLSNGKAGAIKASFADPLEPESSQGIVK